MINSWHQKLRKINCFITDRQTTKGKEGRKNKSRKKKTPREKKNKKQKERN